MDLRTIRDLTLANVANGACGVTVQVANFAGAPPRLAVITVAVPSTATCGPVVITATGNSNVNTTVNVNIGMTDTLSFTGLRALYATCTGTVGTTGCSYNITAPILSFCVTCSVGSRCGASLPPPLTPGSFLAGAKPPASAYSLSD